MELKQEIKELFVLNPEKKISMFVDMNGVIASYRFGEGSNIRNNVPGTYLSKRPIYTVIRNILKLSQEFKNLDLYILSSCLYDEQVAEKNQWLDTYADFFEQDKRYFVLPKNFDGRKCMKVELLEQIMDQHSIDIAILVDDTHDILFKAIDKLEKKVKAYHVISFVD